MTTDASGTSSSAPVEHGNFQAPLGRYFPLDCGMALGLSQYKGALGLPRVGEWGLEFFSNSTSDFHRTEVHTFSETCLPAASLSADLSHPLGTSPAPTGSPGSCLLRWEGAAVQSAPS